MIWSELLSLLRQYNSFLITSHESPDGDSIGSQLVVDWYLRSLGKKTYIYNVDRVPAKFAFLKNADTISNTKPVDRFDVGVIIDCSNPSRIGSDGIIDQCARTINIDHHRDNTQFGTLNYVDTTAASGVVLYRFFTESSIDFPETVACALYTALLTDTGGFRFSNTNSHILSVCADLAARGADCNEIYEKVYASLSPQAMLLQSRIWSTLAFHLDGRVCTMELPLSLIAELGALPSDNEGMADMTLNATGVEVGMLIKHTDAKTHFSLRSKNNIDVGEIAKKIPGGGGHCNAAGCTIEAPLNRAFPVMLDIIRQEIG